MTQPYRLGCSTRFPLCRILWTSIPVCLFLCTICLNKTIEHYLPPRHILFKFTSQILPPHPIKVIFREVVWYITTMAFVRRCPHLVDHTLIRPLSSSSSMILRPLSIRYYSDGRGPLPDPSVPPKPLPEQEPLGTVWRPYLRISVGIVFVGSLIYSMVYLTQLSKRNPD